MKTEGYIAMLVFVWVGFILAISFMEAWLKFLAPGITLELGLGIGKLIFNALNRVEIVIISLLFFIQFKYQQPIQSILKSTFLLPLMILIIQTLWLLPALDIRANKLIAGNVLESSNLHLYYIALEVLKVVILVFIGVKTLKKQTKIINRI